ncbi:hypothetical protein I553_1728 [Mycobacterium xenopi 4042]|uniref:Uncharacterized protein n=1 Tax=Mycobacterium xenopi 4042 TaxID=1299334 RepID=X8AMC3_MYCXE|nr:hypothetical protein I553_1728 [Mycobacterium xenopi 4042]
MTFIRDTASDTAQRMEELLARPAPPTPIWRVCDRAPSRPGARPVPDEPGC